MKNISSITSVVLLLISMQICAQSDGRLDSTFGNKGTVLTNIVSASNVQDVFALKMVKQSNGKIVVVFVKAYMVDGEEQYKYTMSRYSADGQLDVSFGTNGVQELAFDPIDLILIADDQLLLVGREEGEILLKKYQSDGLPDAKFGIGSTIYTGVFLDIRNVTMQTDGKYILCGTSSSKIVLVRLQADGILDDSFGDEGKISFSFNDNAPQFEYAQKVFVLANGGIIVGGSTYKTSYQMAMAKLNPNGKLDTSFSNDGKMIFSNSGLFLSDLTLLPDGKIVLGANNSASNGIALARFQSNGSIDLTFGTNGFRALNFAVSNTNSLAKVIVQPDGKIICVGNVNGNFAILRTDALGTLDKSFNTTGKNTVSSGADFSSNASYAYVLPNGHVSIVGIAQGNKSTNDTLFAFAMSRFITGMPVGISEQAALAPVFVVYPNPSNGKFTVEYESDKVASFALTISNTLGQQISQQTWQLSRGSNTLPIELEASNKGFYFVTISGDNGTLVKRILLD
jgi:uncharacterized delta-60 repeat protein